MPEAIRSVVVAQTVQVATVVTNKQPVAAALVVPSGPQIVNGKSGPSITLTAADVGADTPAQRDAAIAVAVAAGMAPLATVVAGEAIVPGQPVVVSPADGKLYLARADIYTKARVLGIAKTAAAQGFTCDVEAASLTLSDWTATTGSPQLAPGAFYYLGVAPGALTTSRPTTQGLTSTLVGVAVSGNRLALRPLILPILL